MNVCIIPARGGSQRIPRKNIKDFHGKPIIAYSIETAIEASIFDQIIVSTDDPEIASIADSYGASALWRPAGLCRDDVGTQEVMSSVLKHMNNATVACCLYATAPMLAAHVLRDAMWLLNKSDTDYVVPISTWLHDPGQFYLGRAGAFRAQRSLVSKKTMMLPINSATDCDINTPDDWERAEAMYAALKGIKA